ncbi:MAG TPA: CRISPR system precrRNA processing endoribonuclease RAMP protein Cas6 [Clostridiaceae bacterium]|nr:CRISPR system precrRNA processing endoribonuclease RAMP protein Cas6 [Clostridiaceae bacterium]
MIYIFNTRAAIVKFYIQAETKIALPAFKESALRGGFGQVLRKMVCVYSVEKPCYQCELANTCAFSIIFAPSNTEDDFLRNHVGIPRPYCLYILDDKNTLLPGEELTIEMVIVGKAIEYFPYVFLALKELGRIGWGRKETGENARGEKGKFGEKFGDKVEEKLGERGKFFIKKIEEINPDGTYKVVYDYRNENKGKKITGFCLNETFDLVEEEKIESAENFKLIFETPVRLKKDRKITSNPEFETIMRSIIHRLNSLSYFYGDGNREKNASDILEEAKKVNIISNNTSFKQYPYYSRRQSNKLYLGGLVGEVTYNGKLKLFYPYLKSAEVIGVGKNSAFGFGKIKLQILS